MKSEGISNNLKFILKETSPILEIRGGVVEQSDKKLIKGTVVDGMLKTRVVKYNKEKIPFKFVELKDKKGYLPPSILNLYISTFANIEGVEETKKEDEVKATSFGEKKPNKLKNGLIKYGIPVIGGVVGFKIAQKMEMDTKKTAGMVIFFCLIGFLPRYLLKK